MHDWMSSRLKAAIMFLLCYWKLLDPYSRTSSPLLWSIVSLAGHP